MTNAHGNIKPFRICIFIADVNKTYWYKSGDAEVNFDRIDELNASGYDITYCARAISATPEAQVCTAYTADNRSESYPDDINKNCLKDPDMKRSFHCFQSFTCNLNLIFLFFFSIFRTIIFERCKSSTLLRYLILVFKIWKRLLTLYELVQNGVVFIKALCYYIKHQNIYNQDQMH